MTTKINEFNLVREDYLLNSQDPLYGTCNGKFNLISVSASFLEKLLPDKLMLAPQQYTGEAEHPLLLMFNDVHLRSNNPLLPLNLHYNEFVAMIPYVKFKNNSLNEEPAYCFLPVLYLDNLWAVIGGRVFWEFNKNMANFSVTPSSFIVNSEHNAHLLFSSEFIGSGNPVLGTTIENFRKIIPILELTVIEDGLYGFVTSKYKINYHDKLITPIISRTKNKSCRFLPQKTILVPSIEDNVFGGFLMEYDWSLTYPMHHAKQQNIASSDTPKKIAVLGGGLASITAVYKLTEDPNWKSLYDITVYQIGWRLGGKCASGRNGKVAQRIEEHGLHLWFGFYDNAFDIIQSCYKENNLNWLQAFEGYDFVCLEEKINDQWFDWPFTSGKNNNMPGRGSNEPTKGQYLYMLITKQKANHNDFEKELKFKIGAEFENINQSFFTRGLDNLNKALDRIHKEEYHEAKEELREYNKLLESGQFTMTDHEIRHFYILANFTVAIGIGMVEDGVIKGGFKSINGYDFRQWLSRHGAKQITVDSAIVQGVYGLVFGGNNQYTFEAGTALRGLLRLSLTYKGHVYYRMLDGMGDVIFSPFYEVLLKRGVKFEFFNKITNITLSTDKKSVQKIEIDVQATLKPGYDIYNPLVFIDDYPCWPACPNYDQLKEGNDLEQQNVDLESYYSTWPAVSKKTLTFQGEFDTVILGISIGALPAIAKELIEHNIKWAEMINHIVPIPTIAFQLWLNTSINQMKWPFVNKGLALLGSYQEPYDTWADMSQLINKEKWPHGYIPKLISYFCGPTPKDDADLIRHNVRNGDYSDYTFPDLQSKVPYNHGCDYVNKLAAHIWPGCGLVNVPGKDINIMDFDFNQLIDLSDGRGIDRLKHQFFRHNIDPTELYVMSVTDSSKYRLKTDQSGYDNLYLTGDWIDNGFNAGCVEATVMSGLQAARAVSGIYFDIPWENDF